MGEQIKLGTKVKDTITGFTGLVTARVEYIDQPPTVRVEALVNVSEWLVETRVAAVQ